MINYDSLPVVPPSRKDPIFFIGSLERMTVSSPKVEQVDLQTILIPPNFSIIKMCCPHRKIYEKIIKLVRKESIF